MSIFVLLGSFLAAFCPLAMCSHPLLDDIYFDAGLW